MIPLTATKQHTHAYAVTHTHAIKYSADHQVFYVFTEKLLYWLKSTIADSPLFYFISELSQPHHILKTKFIYLNNNINIHV